VDIAIVAMEPSDWDAVCAIYREGVDTGLATFEVETPSWERWNAGHHGFCRLVARSGETIVGFGALSPVSQRACYAGVAEVSVYVSEQARGAGVGRKLLEALIDGSERAGIWTLQGATLAANKASLRLQRACGFREVGRRERIAQLRGVWHDTVITERRSPIIG
jgi:phosphinothricin acetyltransferase